MQMRVSRNVTLTPNASKYTLFYLPVTEINIDVGVYLYMKRFANLFGKASKIYHAVKPDRNFVFVSFRGFIFPIM